MVADTSETLLIEEPATGARLAFTLRELHPEPSVSAQHRLASFVERGLGVHLTRLLTEGKKALHAAGYPPVS
jgi:hypothetical protein